MIKHPEIICRWSDEAKYHQVVNAVQETQRLSPGRTRFTTFLDSRKHDQRLIDLALLYVVKDRSDNEVRPVMRCRPSQAAIRESLNDVLKDRSRRGVIDQLISALNDPAEARATPAAGRMLLRFGLAIADIRSGMNHRDKIFRENQLQSVIGLALMGGPAAGLAAICLLVSGKPAWAAGATAMAAVGCVTGHGANTLQSLRREGRIQRILSQPPI